MRGFLIFLNIVVLLFFLVMFIFLEPLFQIVEDYVTLTALLSSSIKFFLAIVIGFCIGNLTQIFTSTAYQRTRWDIKSFVLLSIIPALFLIAISVGPVVNIITQLPVIRGNSSEFLYYLISSRYIWVLWVGVNLGASIKFPQVYSPKRARNTKIQ
ncbi:MAG: hypothetical protein K9H14_07135 [Actinomycetia bacterium]|nr:hypothetical protein [Actinomycetes bacterium]